MSEDRPSRLIAPNATIGILGGGQLGRMLATAAAQLGLNAHVFCPDPESPAFDVTRRLTKADYSDEEALDLFARDADVITYEFENVPSATAAFLRARRPVFPDAHALDVAQDRLKEKSFVKDLGIATARFCAIDGPDDIKAAIGEIGLPAILKTRRFGYDGKGQVTLRAKEEAGRAWEEIGEVPAILEAHVPFAYEVSVVAARNAAGDFAAYDPPENEHRNYILHQSRVPGRMTGMLPEKAVGIARTIADALDYVGVLAVEMFVVENGGEAEALLVNEIAPRVHNSGHWTMDACQVGQFEQHIRAICGWPLGPVARRSDAVMTNLIGDEVKGWREIAASSDTALHLYGKARIRPGRKMGHFTRLFPLGSLQGRSPSGT